MKNSHRVLVSSDGPDNNVIKLKPPMVFNLENANEFLSAFRECLVTLASTKIVADHLKTGNPHSFMNTLNGGDNHLQPNGEALNQLKIKSQ